MSCLPCGKVTDKEKIVVEYYRKLYKEKGLIFYFYRTKKNETFKIIERKYFNEVYKNEIQPNFKNGAEYFSIQEFKGN